MVRVIAGCDACNHGLCRNKDILSKSKGSSNPHNVVKATFLALINLRSAAKIASARGISLEKVFNG